MVALQVECLSAKRLFRARLHRNAPLQYSLDGKYLFQREAHAVRVISSRNGHVLHECVHPNAMCQVVSIALHPSNSLQIFVGYEDGSIYVWDFIEEKILQEFDVKAPLLWMESSKSCESLLFVVTLTDLAHAPQGEETPKDLETTTTHDHENSNYDTKQWNLVEFNLKKKKKGRILLTNKMQTSPFVTASLQSTSRMTSSSLRKADFASDLMVIVADTKVYMVRMEKNLTSVSVQSTFTKKKLTHCRAVTCVAVSPTLEEFVIGDIHGQIHRFIIDEQEGFHQSMLHWHAHAVQCVNYSMDGVFLVSGGEENVFVSWHLQTGRRSFLPRQTAPLQTIATCFEYGHGHPQVSYAVLLEDHTLFQYNPITRAQEWILLGLARSGQASRLSVPNKHLIMDPTTKALVLNGLSSAGALQLYEPYHDRILKSIVLTERNQVTRTEDETLPQVIAEHVEFSSKGDSLVTIHTLVADDGKESVSLKEDEEDSLRFWSKRQDGSFFVNTAIDAPHGNNKVTCMAYHPSEDLLVTCDTKGEFKFWIKTTIFVKSRAANSTADHKARRVQDTAGTDAAKRMADAPFPGEATMSCWTCRSVATFRDAKITCVAFSQDGSLVAIAYENFLTLWDPFTNTLVQVLACCAPKQDVEEQNESKTKPDAIEQVIFCGSASTFVVVRTQKELQVWNLLQCKLWWSVPITTASQISLCQTPMSIGTTEEPEFVLCSRVAKANETDKPATTKPKSNSTKQAGAKEEQQFTNVLLWFSPTSAIPKRVFHFDAVDLWCLVSYAPTGDLLALDQFTNVWRIGTSEQARETRRQLEEQMTNPQSSSAQTGAPNALSSLFKLSSGSTPAQVSKSSMQASRNSVKMKELFDAPAHVLPSMTSLYRSFMDTMLPKHSSVVSSTGVTDLQTGDSSSSSSSAKKQQRKRKKVTKVALAKKAKSSLSPALSPSKSLLNSKQQAQLEKELAMPIPHEAFQQFAQAITGAQSTKKQ